MQETKYYIALDDFERRVLVNCLNEVRNRLISDGKYTDGVDDILLKIIDAKTGLPRYNIPIRYGSRTALFAFHTLENICGN